ncbi:serine hydrolase domain-containing protein [Roseateles albus]|uniref:Serine hydrolase n=1 Tax=Roseateles albus TaxID=2987525 RepID=A0ABT5KFF2_9BURK|nr:serine hydrolase domain-containing protein [Roseateles albus]MDC8772662.1 serine hydrolase [Roseateles albus]
MHSRSVRWSRLALACTFLLAGAAAAQQASNPVLSAAAPAALPSATPTQPQDVLRLLDLWLDAQVAYERVPALSVALQHGPELLWKKGYGKLDAAGKLPAGTDTVYGICSISKLFTSVAVMQLWEQGKFSLDDDIGKLLPGFTLQRTDPDSGPISVRSLLTHSSGLPREADFAYWTPPEFKFPTREQMMQALAGQSSFMRAADRFQYSNLGMSLLGELVTQLSGMPYEDYVQRHILVPLQLADTRTALPTELQGKRLAQGWSAPRRDGTREALKPYVAGGITPAAGFSSTVEDLARFAAWQFRLRKQGGSELLKVSTLREMQRVQWTNPDGKETWGLGFAVYRDGNQTLAGHSGLCPGYQSSLSLVLEDELAVAAMSNANETEDFGPRFTKPIRKLMEKGMKLPVGSADLLAYAGRYNAQPWASEMVIVPWGEQLALLPLPTHDPAGDMQVLKSMGKDEFRVLRDDGSLGEAFRFRRDAAGQVDGVENWSQLMLRLGALR